MPLALHALAELKRRGIACELAVAGEGKELQKLRTLSRQLALDNHVSFLGVVEDMSTFYDNIDCFLCPSLREPFGLVCAEAMAHGCPVIATKVDGLPEVVLHGETGFCLDASLPLQDYPAFGGATDDVPELIYNPVSDSLEPPKLVDPRLIADAVARLLDPGAQYETMSRQASVLAREKFDYKRHAHDVLETIIAFYERDRRL
jgi:glycosyltransferase involved in cell wall biosynthesis